VCAGIVIAQEAGCAVTGSHAIFSASCSGNKGDMMTEILAGRKFLVVRAIADTPVRVFQTDSNPR
jgi:myo-inositol-1(or 4)-monophosphatase